MSPAAERIFRKEVELLGSCVDGILTKAVGQLSQEGIAGIRGWQGITSGAAAALLPKAVKRLADTINLGISELGKHWDR